MQNPGFTVLRCSALAVLLGRWSDEWGTQCVSTCDLDIFAAEGYSQSQFCLEVRHYQKPAAALRVWETTCVSSTLAGSYLTGFGYF